jgi:DNA-directed RNA polymerase beta' subunit
LYNNIAYALINEIQERLQTPIPLHKKYAAELLCMLIRSELNPRVISGLSDEQLDHIIRLIRTKYSNSLIEYGTAVGILAAQSISEPLTQYMLDSHHRSVGTGTSKSGVVRIAELYSSCDINKEHAPVMCIPINENLLRDNEDSINTTIQEISNAIEYLTFQQFIKNKKILLEPFNDLIHPAYKSDQIWIDEYKDFHPLMIIPVDLTNWCFRFVIDKSILVLKAVDLELIINRLRVKHNNIFVVFTPEASVEIIIRIWIRPSQKRGISIEDSFNDIMNSILMTSIKGINKIIQATVEQRKEYKIGPDNELVESKTYVLNTKGTNLYDVLLYNKLFDATAITSNSVPDTLKMYGIEAARMKIITETRAIIANSNINVNIRHLYIYADERTRPGRVTSIERSGLSAREKNNVLLLAGHQNPIATLINASLNNVKSPIYGVAAPQILGMLPKVGTTYNKFIVDEEFVKKNVISIDEILDNI